MAPPKPQGGIISKIVTKGGVKFHNAVYRLSGGRIAGHMMGGPILLLTTMGRKSGQPRMLPLLYLGVDEGYVIVASYAGSDKHPAWFLNIEADANVELQVGADKFSATAEIVDDEQRALLWPKLVDMYGDYAVYQARSARKIPVVLIRRNG